MLKLRKIDPMAECSWAVVFITPDEAGGFDIEYFMSEAEADAKAVEYDDNDAYAMRLTKRTVEED